MSNPNSNKQTNVNAGQDVGDRAPEDNTARSAVTEDELDAYRFRGTPIRRRSRPMKGERDDKPNRHSDTAGPQGRTHY